MIKKKPPDVLMAVYLALSLQPTAKAEPVLNLPHLCSPTMTIKASDSDVGLTNT